MFFVTSKAPISKGVLPLGKFPVMIKPVVRGKNHIEVRICRTKCGTGLLGPDGNPDSGNVFNFSRTFPRCRPAYSRTSFGHSLIPACLIGARSGTNIAAVN